MSADCPLTYVVVLTYNGKRFLESCFKSLLATEYPNARFLLIDNASTEDLASYVKERFPDVETVRLETNAGPAGAANFGINYAIEQGAVYVAVCHDDVVMVVPRWLDQAVGHMQKDPRAGIVWFEETPPRDEFQVDDRVCLRSVQYPCGCALVMRASLVKNLGAYDTIYHAAADDDDLVARALKAGYRVGQFNIPVVHHGSGTYRRHDLRTAYYHMRNCLRFSIKHRGPLRWPLRIARMLDVSCNPWPLTLNPQDACHDHWRNRGNVLLNAGLLACAIGWNFVRLPQTLYIRARESRLVRASRQRLQQEPRAARPLDLVASHAES